MVRLRRDLAALHEYAEIVHAAPSGHRAAPSVPAPPPGGQLDTGAWQELIIRPRTSLGIADASVPDRVNTDLDHVGQAAGEYLAERHLSYVVTGGGEAQGGEEGRAECLGRLPSTLIY